MNGFMLWRALRRLKHGGSSFTRIKAAEKLSISRGPRALQALIEALKAEERCDVRAAIARALGRIGQAEAVQSLADALNDQDRDVQAEAITALAQIGNSQAVSHLVGVLDHPEHFVRQHATRVLGRLGDPTTAKPLLTALRRYLHDWTIDYYYERRPIVSDLVEALGNIKGQEVEEVLIPALNEEPLVRSEVVRMLKERGWQPADAFQRALWAIAREEWDEAVSMGTVALPLLITVLTRDTELYSNRAAAARALRSLAWQPTDDAQRALYAVGLEAWDEAEKLGPIAIDPLLMALDRCEQESVREGAARTLGKIGDPRSVDSLVEVLQSQLKKGKEPVSVLAAVIRALGEIGDARAVQVLIRLRHADQQRIVIEAASALTKIGPPAIDALCAVLEKPDFLRVGAKYIHEDYRDKALEILMTIAGARAVGRLVNIARSNTKSAILVIQALQGLLERCASDATSDDLFLAAALSDVNQEYWDNDSYDDEFLHSRLATVDCSAVRQMAERELRRRGLNVSGSSKH